VTAAKTVVICLGIVIAAISLAAMLAGAFGWVP
jgi:hypothetical protein